MQLKERWARWRLRQSVSSGASSSGNSDTTPPRVASAIYIAFPNHLKYTTTTTSSDWRPKPTSTKMFWRNTAITMVPEKRAPSPSSKRQKKKKKSNSLKRPHPSERTLTEQNLRHQEMLGTFTMKFGKRRRGSVGDRAWEAISPGNSRACSLDEPRGGADLAEEEEGPVGERRESSLVGALAAQERLVAEES